MKTKHVRGIVLASALSIERGVRHQPAPFNEAG
jgi:hypothetical protein